MALCEIEYSAPRRIRISRNKRFKMTTETFAALAHRKLVGNRQWSVRSVASEMSMSYESLYARLYERTPFNPEELRSLFAVVHDVELANYLLALSPLIAVERSEVGSSPAESLQRGALKALLDATDIVRSTEKALIDGRLDHQEKAEIQEQVAETERAIASLKQLLGSLG